MNAKRSSDHTAHSPRCEACCAGAQARAQQAAAERECSAGAGRSPAVKGHGCPASFSAVGPAPKDSQAVDIITTDDRFFAPETRKNCVTVDLVTESIDEGETIMLGVNGTLGIMRSMKLMQLWRRWRSRGPATLNQTARPLPPRPVRACSRAVRRASSFSLSLPSIPRVVGA